MAADVITKVISANDYKGGGVLTAVQKNGTYQYLAPPLGEDEAKETAFFNKMDTRLDDVRFYTGDAAT